MNSKTENDPRKEINPQEKTEDEAGKNTKKEPTANKLPSPNGEFIEWAESTSTNY